MRCEDRVCLGHRFQKPRHGVLQPLAHAGVGGEDVAVRSAYTDMHMHAVAGVIGIGLGHEGGLHPVRLGHAAHKTAEEHRHVGGGQCVVGVVEIDLVLPRAVLGDQCIRGQALHCARGLDVAQDRLGPIEYVELVILRIGREGWGQGGRLGRVSGLEDVELELGGEHRGEALIGEPLQDTREMAAR